MGKYDDKDREELIEILEQKDRDLKRKKLGLYWDREIEKEDVVENCENKLPTLVRVEKNSIKTKEDVSSPNVLIEGDNYHALQVLNYTHKGKIDVIYIDPPYNTGTRDWIYGDHIVDPNDGYRHSKWLNMMEKRLSLARSLLSKRGVIFISIDDNEQARLKLLCDSVFSSKNYLNKLNWINNLKGRQIANKPYVKTYEHILLYAKNADDIYEFGYDKRDEEIKSMKDIYKNAEYEEFTDKKGKYVIKNELYNTNSKTNEETRPNLCFNILYNPRKNSVKFSDFNAKTRVPKGYFLIAPKKNNDGVHSVHAWRWSREKIESETDDLEFVKTDSGYKIYTKIRDIYSVKAKDLISISGGDGTLKEMKLSFPNPKPVKLLKFLFKSIKKNDITILDFFAGSGTTGHAVLDLNKEDGGNRKFILCTNNENKIAEDVTYPRIKKAINGYKKNGKKDSVKGLGGNLEYFKTDFVEKMNSRAQLKYNLAQKCGQMLCLKEGIFNKHKSGTDYEIYVSNDKKQYLCIYYNFVNKSFDKFLKDLENIKERKLIHMFAEGDDVDEKQFNSIQNKKIIPIPKRILEVYNKIIRDNRRQ